MMLLKANILFTLCFLAGLNISAQGINWAEGLSWEQVKSKARQENKYIFIDAFTTWCGPCKIMDKEVYPNDTVGSYMNSTFISVKVQMDKTSKDNEVTKSWYKDAEELQKIFRVDAYPSYIFLNPAGEIVHKATGYKPIKYFLETVREAVTPGKIYENPYSLYEKLVNAYGKGEKNFSQMPYIVKIAKGLGDVEIAQKVAKEFTNHLFSLGDSALYTRQSIEYFVNTYEVISSKSRIFKLFYPDHSRVDAVMNKEGYAKKIVSDTIYEEIIKPYLGMMQGGMMALETPKDLKIPNWKEMNRKIKAKYGPAFAKENVLAAKVRFYYKAAMYEEWVKCFFMQMDQYGWDTANDDMYAELNLAGWTIFQKISNKKYLNKACEFMKVVIDRYPQMFNFIDTYANLLYKSGRPNEAIAWEMKAVEATGDKFPKKKRSFLEITEKMKKGEPTWTGKIF